jgi:hypothetical protein
VAIESSTVQCGLEIRAHDPKKQLGNDKPGHKRNQKICAPRASAAPNTHRRPAKIWVRTHLAPHQAARKTDRLPLFGALAKPRQGFRTTDH